NRCAILPPSCRSSPCDLPDEPQIRGCAVKSAARVAERTPVGAEWCRPQTNPAVGEELMLTYEFLATWLRARFDDEKGASLVEYARRVAPMAVLCTPAAPLLGKTAA